jgi:hypothetical protein
MITLRYKYWMPIFKVVLVIIGLAFFIEQGSFQFYRFATFSCYEPVVHAISHRLNSPSTSDFLNYNKQLKTSLLLDKRYDLKHVFITPVPLFRFAGLPIESHNQFCSLVVAYAGEASHMICMRGPPCPL